MSQPHQIELPSFIKDYMCFATNNEASPLYHIFCCLYTLSAAIGRKVKVVNGFFQFYPNLYIVLVGEPAAGKNTALDLAKEVLREVRFVAMAPDAPTIQALTRWMSGSDLKEGMISPCRKTFKDGEGKLREYTQAAIIVGEFISFIAVDPHNWIVNLTNLYSEEAHDISTKNKGNDFIVAPYVTILGGLTPDVSQQIQKANIISTGFGSRTNFIWGTRGKPIALFTKTPEHMAARARVVQRIKELEHLSGEFNWDAAKDWYSEWYYGPHEVELRNATLQTKGYYGRKNLHLFKIAMLVALAESNNLTLLPHHFEIALEFLRQSELDLYKVVGGSGRNEDAQVAIAVLERLEQIDDGVPPKRLLGEFWDNLHGGQFAFDAIIKYLTTTGKIIAWQEPLPLLGPGKFVSLLATPSGFKNFKTKLQASPQPSPSPQSSTTSDLVIELDPPSGPSSSPVEKPEPAVPVVPSPVPATATSVPPTHDPKSQTLELDLPG